MTAGRPAGGVHLTFADWASFARAHLLGARGVPSIVSAESFHILHTAWPGPAADYAEGYALGWHVMSIDGQHVLAHGGAGDLRAGIQIWPERGTALLVIANCDDPPGRSGMDAALLALRRRAGLS
jgi:CubicO group peptidase (beta-lactamase class C family)